MKIIERFYLVCIVAILAGIVFHAPLSVGFGTLFPDYQMLIKSWKEILLVIVATLAVIAVTKRKLWREYARDWIFRLIAGYSILHVLLVLLMWRGGDETAAGLAIDLRYVLFFGLTYTFIKLWPRHRSLLLVISLISAGIVVAFGLLQIFILPADILSHIGYSNETIAPYLTVDKNPDYIRINSTLRGPNPLGAYMVVIIALLVAPLAKSQRIYGSKNMRLIAIVTLAGAFVVLFASYSRSALVAGLAALTIVGAVATAHKLSRRSWILMSILIGGVVGALAIGWSSSFVSQVILHENPSGGSVRSSNDEHVASLESGFGRMLNQPFGAGIGSTGSASLYGNGDQALIVENQYLFIAHETGWLGLGLFLTLYILIMQRLWRGKKDWLSLGLFASGVGLFLVGILLPVWADDTVSIIWWGLAGIALGGRYGKSKSN